MWHHGFMGVTPEIRARLTKAGRNYTRAKEAFDAARAELVKAIVDARKEGTLIEDIAGGALPADAGQPRS